MIQTTRNGRHLTITAGCTDCGRLCPESRIERDGHRAGETAMCHAESLAIAVGYREVRRKARRSRSVLVDLICPECQRKGAVA
jgi:MinD superfamily P-loop ATPase